MGSNSCITCEDRKATTISVERNADHYASTIHPQHPHTMVDWFNCPECGTTFILMRPKKEGEEQFNNVESPKVTA